MRARISKNFVDEIRQDGDVNFILLNDPGVTGVTVLVGDRKRSIFGLQLLTR